jgi:hypothetical protein
MIEYGRFGRRTIIIVFMYHGGILKCQRFARYAAKDRCQETTSAIRIEKPEEDGYPIFKKPQLAILKAIQNK